MRVWTFAVIILISALFLIFINIYSIQHPARENGAGFLTTSSWGYHDPQVMNNIASHCGIYPNQTLDAGLRMISDCIDLKDNQIEAMNEELGW